MSAFELATRARSQFPSLTAKSKATTNTAKKITTRNRVRAGLIRHTVLGIFRPRSFVHRTSVEISQREQGHDSNKNDPCYGAEVHIDNHARYGFPVLARVPLPLAYALPLLRC